MTYTLSPEQVASITDIEYAFGTTKLLPQVEDIPPEFRAQSGNIFTKIAECLFYKCEAPNVEMRMNYGFDQELVSRCIIAHLRSWAPKHQHKIAGVGLMISLTMTVIESPQKG